MMLAISEFIKRPNPYTKTIFSLSIISIVSLICYGNSLHNNFVYDDKSVIERNELVRDINSIPLIFTTSYWAGYRWEGIEKEEQSLYRPLVIFSYTLNYLVGGFNPFNYHLINLILHLINSILVFLLCLYLFESWRWISSLVVSLLFAAHPIHTEAVTNVVGRAELLCFCFFISSLLFYIKARLHESSHCCLFYLLSLGGYFLALLSKESAITLLGVVILFDWLYRYQSQLRAIIGNGLNEIKRSYLGFFLVTLLYFIIRFFILKNPFSPGPITLLDNPLITASSCQRILTALKVIGNYLTLLLFPIRLSADYSFNQIPVSTTFFAPEELCSLFLIITTVGLAFWCSRKLKILSFSIFFFYITLSVTSNLLVLIGTIMAERLLYLSSLGFCIFMVVLVQKALVIIPVWPSHKQRTFFSYSLIVIILFLVSLYTIRTWIRNRDWKDEAHLFSSVVRSSPGSARGHNQMAAVYFQNGNYEMALKEAKRAIEIYPDYKEARYCLGTTYNKVGKYDKAIVELTRAIHIHPRYPSALLNLGISYHYLKQYDKAIRTYKHLISIRPDYVEAYNNLGISYYFKGAVEEATRAYLDALKLKPDYAEVCKNLGVLYYNKKGDIKRSVYYLEKSLELNPEQHGAKQIRELLQFIENKTTE